MPWRRQQQDTDQPAARAARAPIPAYHSPLASAANNEQDQTTIDSQIATGHSIVDGIKTWGWACRPTGHSYWQPHVDLMSTVDSNPLTTQGQTGWSTVTSVFAGVDLHSDSGNSMLTVNYVGGGLLSNDGSEQRGLTRT